MASVSSLSFKLAAFTFSLSFFNTPTSSASSYLSIVSFSKASNLKLLFSSLSSSNCSNDSNPPLSRAQATATDLLAILGGPDESGRVDPSIAAELRSCLRVLEGEDYDKVKWPPAPVMELARLAVDSGGDLAEIQRLLDPTMLPVPDVEGTKEDKCQLTRTSYARRFVNKELNGYFAFLFEIIAKNAPLVGLNITLNRYDLFHGHIFLATDSGRLGILFHAKEYPAYDKNVFPYNMGYCQIGSNVVYDDSINLRNVLWLAPLPYGAYAWHVPGFLAILDARPDGVIYKTLVPEYVDYVRTIYEDEFGELVADVNYFNIGNIISGDRIFIC